MTNVYSPAQLSHLGLRDFPWFGTDQGHWQLEQKKNKKQLVSGQSESQPTKFTSEREDGQKNALLSQTHFIFTKSNIMFDSLS